MITIESPPPGRQGKDPLPIHQPAPQPLVEALRFRASSISTSAATLEEYVYSCVAGLNVEEAAGVLAQLTGLMGDIDAVQDRLFDLCERREKCRA
jgi:hypothetical protein